MEKQIVPVIYDQYNRPPEAFEKVSDETITETAGYVPSDRQIEDMIIAGRRLNEARAQAFDFAPGEEDDGEFYDPTRSPGFDLADASRLVRNIAQKIKKQAKAESDEKNREAPRSEVSDGASAQEKAPEGK